MGTWEKRNPRPELWGLSSSSESMGNSRGISQVRKNRDWIWHSDPTSWPLPPLKDKDINLKMHTHPYIRYSTSIVGTWQQPKRQHQENSWICSRYTQWNTVRLSERWSHAVHCSIDGAGGCRVKHRESGKRQILDDLPHLRYVEKQPKGISSTRWETTVSPELQTLEYEVSGIVRLEDGDVDCTQQRNIGGGPWALRWWWEEGAVHDKATTLTPLKTCDLKRQLNKKWKAIATAMYVPSCCSGKCSTFTYSFC